MIRESDFGVCLWLLSRYCQRSETPSDLELNIDRRRQRTHGPLGGGMSWEDGLPLNAARAPEAEPAESAAGAGAGAGVGRGSGTRARTGDSPRGGLQQGPAASPGHLGARVAGKQGEAWPAFD